MTTTTAAVDPVVRRSPARRYAQSLWLLTRRDLKVRYTTSLLGYLWSVIDPLLMAGIYFFVFVVVFHRDHQPGQEPYIVFLVSGLLPWTWFTNAVNDSAKAFTREAKLLRSTTIPRTIWVTRTVLSNGIEFLLSIPVLLIFAIIFTYVPSHPTEWHWQGWLLWLLAVPLQALLLVGIGLIVAPLVVFFRDLERVIRLVLRLLFYASTIIYGPRDLDRIGLHTASAFNPLTGIVSLYRSPFFPGELSWFDVVVGTGVSLLILLIGVAVFRRSVPTVLKEL